jgi:hypothetical protein
MILSRDPKVLYVGDDHCAAILSGVVLIVVRQDPDASILEHQKRWIRQMRSEAPDGSAFIAVLRSDTPPPTEAARAIIKRVFLEFGQVVKAGAMVIEGAGFVAATFRSVLSMILLALRPSYPFRIFADLREGCDWVSGHLGDSGRVRSAELVNAFEDLKTRYRAGTLKIDE